MALSKHNGELLITERRGVIGAIFRALGRGEPAYRIRRGRRFGRISIRRLLRWIFALFAIFLVYLTVFGVKMQFHGKMEGNIASPREVSREMELHVKSPKSKHRKLHHKRSWRLGAGHYSLRICSVLSFIFTRSNHL